MRIFDPERDDGPLDSDELIGAADLASARGRTAGIWALTLVNLALAALAAYGIVFVAGARDYLTGESLQFGGSLETTLAGLTILRIGCFVLVVGFALSALCTISLTRFGWLVQAIWAVVTCATVAGIPYGLTVVIFLFRRQTRERFFRRTSLSSNLT